MNHLKKKLLYLICLSVVFAGSCKDDESGSNLKSIEVTPQSLSLAVGESKEVTVKTDPLNATGVSFLWESDDKSIATTRGIGPVSGAVTGVAKGATTITVKSGNISKKIPVTVTQSQQILIGGVSYSIDTLNYEVVSQGVQWFKFSIPEYVNNVGLKGKGLVVNALEVDLSFPSNKIDVWTASLVTANVERPTVAYKRLKIEYASSGLKPVAATNGDFYLLSSVNDTYGYVDNRPRGIEISSGMVVQTPFNDPREGTYRGAFIFGDDRFPRYTNQIGFSGRVDFGNESIKLQEVNGFAKEGELVLFNNRANSWPTDSALVWSPYTSTMVSLSYPEGGWRVNDRMEFTVTAIDYDVKSTIPAPTTSPYYSGGKDFNGEGAILVGNPSSPSLNDASKLFLSKLKVGDKVGVKMDILVNGAAVPDKKMNAIGFRHDMLKRGVVYNTWNEVHPRTAIGYSQDQKKVYLLVVDGRNVNYSVGATTGVLGTILKWLGAYEGVNLDGGGSSVMVVDGEIKNKPSDGSERAVANGLIVLTK